VSTVVDGKRPGKPKAARAGLAISLRAYICTFMKAIARPWPLSPLIVLQRLVRNGLLPALAFALAADTQLFDASKECKGAFSSAFSNGFDVHRCQLNIKAIGADFKFSIPLPSR
jgi:hypothetical protein